MKKKKTATPQLDNIDPRICFNGKIRKLSRMITPIYEKALQKFELRSSQLSILMILGKMGSANQKTIAEYLFMDPSTLSRDLNKLVERRWIETTRGTDARNSHLQLTDIGFKLLEEVLPVWKEINDKLEKTLGSFSASTLDTIAEGLKQYTE